jgi:hypothetical protein
MGIELMPILLKRKNHPKVVYRILVARGGIDQG